mmetsp:Transcript_42777/g.98135  ORF Transcript_42777/g.98135 Transcript_42777/m.98135 type:complete len:92 (-) Transcript_42777:541-816(-)
MMALSSCEYRNSSIGVQSERDQEATCDDEMRCQELDAKSSLLRAGPSNLRYMLVSDWRARCAEESGSWSLREGGAPVSACVVDWCGQGGAG